MTVKRLIGSAPSQISRNRDLGTMAFQDVTSFKGPAFQAYLAQAQTVSSSVTSQVQLNGVIYDTNNCYNSSGSTVTMNGRSVPGYCFSPNVAGYYHVTAQVGYNSGTVATMPCQIQLYKNGGMIYEGPYFYTIYANVRCHADFDVYCNGTSDYIYITFAQSTGSSASLLAMTTNTYMSAFLARGA